MTLYAVGQSQVSFAKKRKLNNICLIPNCPSFRLVRVMTRLAEETTDSREIVVQDCIAKRMILIGQEEDVVSIMIFLYI